MIGIIGGAGVAAGLKMADLLEKKFLKLGAYRDQHHPEVLLYQATQAPSRSLFLEGKGQSFIPYYIDAAQKLQSLGAQIICMTCNTAHYAFNAIQQKISATMVNMIRASINKLHTTYKSNEKFTVGILCSHGCKLAKIYDDEILRQFPYANILHTNEPYQNKVSKGISLLKKSANNIDLSAESLFYEATEQFHKQGAEVIILGCTEISLCFNTKNFPSLMIIDSLDMLADKCIELFFVTNIEHVLFSNYKKQK